MAKKSSTSRSARWNDAIGDIERSVMALKELNEEYMEWKSNIEGADTADNLMQGATYEKLEQVEELDVEGKMYEVESLVQELYDAELPVGFGND